MNADVALARAQLYALLAEGFDYPGEEFHAALVAGTYRHELAEALAEAQPDRVGGFRKNWAMDLAVEQDFAEFEAGYLAAFETNAPRPSLSLYQGTYLQGESRSDLLLEIKGFYTNFGLSVAPELHELEDRLTAEFDFMHFLATKQGTASEYDLKAEPYILAQRDFLARHLGPWLPRLAEEAAKREIGPFHRALAGFAADFVTADQATMMTTAAHLGAAS